jgi:hypothetical protein
LLQARLRQQITVGTLNVLNQLPTFVIQLLFLGIGLLLALDQQACDRWLSACLLTREELEQGEQMWRLLQGPFPEAELLPHVH